MGDSAGQVLHLDLMALSEGTSEEARQGLLKEAGKLSALDQVRGVFLIEGGGASDFELAFLFLLPDFAALEPFGTNPGYSRFLQGQVAPLLRVFAGADVRLEQPFPRVGPYAACLALEAAEETYDWEVDAALTAWVEQLERSSDVAGLAVGERQRYRGVGLAWGDKPVNAQSLDDSRFASALIIGRSRRLS